MFFKMIIYKVLIISILFSIPSFGQDAAHLFRLYQDKDFIALKENYQKVKAKLSKADQLFFSALYNKDAEKAFATYKDLFQNSNGKLKYYSGERLKDYYYARGYYSTASDYEKYLVENRQLIETIGSTKQPFRPEVVDTEKLFIQVGAFGLKDNAEQMQEMLSTQKVASIIKIRHVKNKELFCVWVIGKQNFKQTLKFADELKHTYHLDYKIIKE
jgi:SPOR domain